MFEKIKDSAGKKIRKANDLISDTARDTGKMASTVSKATRGFITGAATIENVKKIGKSVSDAIETAKIEASTATKSTKETITEKATVENIKKIGEIAAKATDKENIKKVGEVISDVATKENILKAGNVISGAANLENAKSAVKYASGVKGYKEIKEAKQIKKLAEEKITATTEATENKKDLLNKELESYAEVKIRAIKNTICVFVEFLKEIGQRNKGREYDALKSIDIKKEDIAEIQDIGIKSTNFAKGVTGSTAIGAVALFGTKALVLKGVVAFASASTGTAISSLSGAAATNATLAFFGGGSIASGGGGVAAGTVVLGGITASAFAGFAALTGGVLLSAHGSKALTRAKKYSADVDKAVSTLEKSWVVMDGIKERVEELKDLTLKLEQRAIDELKELEPLVPIFEPNNLQHKLVFQKTALLMKSIGEIANTPILDKNGNISDACGVMAGKIRLVLTTYKK